MARKSDQADDGRRIVVRNRKAWHEYHIEETLEAGLALVGSEVKSVRAGRVTLTGGFVTVDDGEAWLREVHITPYEQSGAWAPDPLRPRKLLLRRREIDRLALRSSDAGWTLVPLAVYFQGPYAKLEIGLARGKRAYDKRESLRNREANRERERELAAWRKNR